MHSTIPATRSNNGAFLQSKTSQEGPFVNLGGFEELNGAGLDGKEVEFDNPVRCCAADDSALAFLFSALILHLSLGHNGEFLRLKLKSVQWGRCGSEVVEPTLRANMVCAMVVYTPHISQT